MSYTTRFGFVGTAFLLAVIVIASSVERGRAEEIRLDALKIPAVASGSGGRSSVELEAIVLRPDDRLPHRSPCSITGLHEIRMTARR
jgi:hypothetical protein